MDLSKSKKKIKALTILEKMNNFHKNEIFGNYQFSVKKLEELEKKGKFIGRALVSIEEDMNSSMTASFEVSPELLAIKYQYLDGLYMLQSENLQHTKAQSGETEKFKKELIHVNAKSDLLREKNESETTAYLKSVELIRGGLN